MLPLHQTRKNVSNDEHYSRSTEKSQVSDANFKLFGTFFGTLVFRTHPNKRTEEYDMIEKD